MKHEITTWRAKDNGLNRGECSHVSYVLGAIISQMIGWRSMHTVLTCSRVDVLVSVFEATTLTGDSQTRHRVAAPR